MKRFIALALTSGILPAAVATAATLVPPAPMLDEVTIIGSREQARTLPGSAWVIDQQDLETFQYTDINRVLTQVPGVYAIDEEGLGLRPNIGIRGSGTERSSKVTLMEDGALIAPAAYADPAAYYFPTTGRLAGVEILKGAPLLSEGPYTVGGAVNLLSTAIPTEFGGQLTGEFGSHAETRVHASIGDSTETYGWLLEIHQHRSDGFQQIDRSSRDAGLRKQDYLGKLRLNTPQSFAGPYQQVDLRLGYAEETSNSSYLGLTDADFSLAPRRRYGLTEQDQMDNQWQGTNLSYTVDFSDTVSWHLTVYRNHFARDWFKVDRIGGASIAAVMAAANQGDPTAIAQLQGTQDTAVTIKHNAREYTTKGVQSRLEWHVTTGNIAHSLQLGTRWHRDEIDRFQPIEQFQQMNGALAFTTEVLPTGSDNREESARAQAYWLLDTLSLSDTVELTLALRHEDIATRRIQYATPDRSQLSPASAQLQNTTREWLPGAGIIWQLAERWQLLAGVHKGMAPAGAGAIAGTDPELSINYESGFRYGTDRLNVELIGFYSDYENSARNCSIAFPCASNADSGTEQLGGALIKGVEFSVDYRPEFAGLRWPLRLSYTHTDAQITAHSDGGDILDGDEYPYVPRKQLYLGAGVEGSTGWSINAAGRYLSAMCVDFQCERDGVDNTFRKTDSMFIVDLAASYPLSDTARVYARVDNVFADEGIVSRSPAGARPSKPRAVIVGFSVNY